MNSWRNFNEGELACSCCGEQNPNIEFVELMDMVQELRDIVGFPLPVSSAYRCESHPIERAKKKPGQHNIAAIDLAVGYGQAHTVLKAAMLMGFTGVGINQKGNGRFIHLDLRDPDLATVWTY